MHIVQRPVREMRRMHSPSERMVVNNARLGNVARYNYYSNGLSGVDGLFNIGKMFTRMVTIKPKSFTLGNIVGALGSATMFTATGGLAALAPKVLSAKSEVSKIVGGATLAIGAAAGGAALLPAGALTTAGSALSSVGGTLLKGGMGVLSMFGGVGGGGGQVQQQQSGMSQAEYDAYMAQQAQVQQQLTADQLRAQAEYERQQQAQYAAYMAQQQGYTPVSMQTSYGDLRSPYTAITEDGEQVQVDPNTGQVIQPGMSKEMIIGIGAVTLLAGWFLMSD